MNTPAYRTLILTTLVCRLLFASAVGSALASEGGKLKWLPWDETNFARAKAENKLVILDLHAVWCHWCHVMDEVTYSDPEVIEVLNKQYITVGVDQDSRPDISNRYEDYGWPATIIFDGDGRELAKLSGYYAPKGFLPIIEKLAKTRKPDPELDGGSVGVSTGLGDPSLGANRATKITPEMTQLVTEKVIKSADLKMGAFDIDHKQVTRTLVEWAQWVIGQGEKVQGEKNPDYPAAKQIVEKTLANVPSIIDPVWGGVYQYSTDNDWQHPHFEKILSYQTDGISMYAKAYSIDQKPEYLKAAKDIDRFVSGFLTAPGGGFYTSQDADAKQGEHAGEYFKLGDAERRKQGIPRIDKNQYSRENGWVIQALLDLYTATGERVYLDRARKATDWVISHRAIPGGGFIHGEKAEGPYLGDTLTMAMAFLKFYASTGERRWLVKCEESIRFIESKFKQSAASGKIKRPVTYVTSAQPVSTKLPSLPQADENLALARLYNQLFYYTGKKEYRASAEALIPYLYSERNRRSIFLAPGLLLLDLELKTPPVHITVVGAKSDPLAQKLFAAALSYGAVFKRTEWFDPAEGPLPNGDVQYPQLKTAAAFACGAGRCSLPATSPEQLRERVKKFK